MTGLPPVSSTVVSGLGGNVSRVAGPEPAMVAWVPRTPVSDDPNPSTMNALGSIALIRSLVEAESMAPPDPITNSDEVSYGVAASAAVSRLHERSAHGVPDDGQGVDPLRLERRQMESGSKWPCWSTTTLPPE